MGVFLVVVVVVVVIVVVIVVVVVVVVFAVVAIFLIFLGGQSSSFFVGPWNGAGVGGPSPRGLRGALRVPFVSGVLRGDRPPSRLFSGWLAGSAGWAAVAVYVGLAGLLVCWLAGWLG